MERITSKFTRVLVVTLLCAAMSATSRSQGKQSVIYAIDSDGKLKWYVHVGAATGAGLETPGAWIGARDGGDGWNDYTRVFPGGGNIIYGIKADGSLEWRRHRGLARGDDTWEPTKNVGRGWGGFADVFSGGDGVIYVIQSDGTLRWYKHLAYRTGAGLETAGAWSGPRNVGRGWSGFKHVFSGGNGVIYVIAQDGTLKWYRHKAYLTGDGLETPGAWEGPKNVGRGWGDVQQVFSSGDGVIYTVTQDGKLWWYRHYGYLDGRGLESAGAWEGRKEVGRGWGDSINVFALLPFNDSLGAPGAQTSGDVTTRGTSSDSTTLERRQGGIRRNDDTVLAERQGRSRSDTAPESNQILCRGSDDRIRVAGSATELQDLYIFRTISSRLDSTGAAILTIELGGNTALVAAGSNGAGLREGNCAWMDRPVGGQSGVSIRFEVPANAQLNQARHGTPVDTSPTAAERFPDASNIPIYFRDVNHYWIFTVTDSGRGYMLATDSRHWKRTPGLGDAITQPVDTRRVRSRDRVLGPTKP